MKLNKRQFHETKVEGNKRFSFVPKAYFFLSSMRWSRSETSKWFLFLWFVEDFRAPCENCIVKNKKLREHVSGKISSFMCVGNIFTEIYRARVPSVAEGKRKIYHFHKTESGFCSLHHKTPKRKRKDPFKWLDFQFISYFSCAQFSSWFLHNKKWTANHDFFSTFFLRLLRGYLNWR